MWRNTSCGEDSVCKVGSVGSKLSELSILALSDEYTPLFGGTMDGGGGGQANVGVA